MDMPNICWFNATEHDINIFELNEDGVTQGFIQRGVPLNFMKKGSISPSNVVARLVSNYRERPKELVVQGIILREHQPWNEINLDPTQLPGRTYVTDPVLPDQPTHVYLIVSLPVAEFLVNKRSTGQFTNQRVTPTLIVCPDTGPGSKIMDENGRIIGVTGLKSFGPYTFVKRF